MTNWLFGNITIIGVIMLTLIFIVFMVYLLGDYAKEGSKLKQIVDKLDNFCSVAIRLISLMLWIELNLIIYVAVANF